MKHIELDHFRCYENQSFDFRPGINLLIGDNASGKTSLLMACKYVLSSFFSGFSDENTKWISPSKNDFYMRIVDGVLQNGMPLQIKFNFDENQFPVLNPNIANAPFNIDNEFVIQKKSPKNKGALTTGLKDFKNYAFSLQTCYAVFDMNNQRQIHTRPLPLFAAFTTEDIHSTRKINEKPFRNYFQKRSFGYYECLEGNGLYPYWRKRLLVLQEGQKNVEEIAVVNKAIYDALGPEGCNIITGMDVRPMQGYVYYTLVDGREIESDLLSDGYKRLVNIVTDIAIRCALLNRPYFGEQSAELTKGTVLIDEIDMHLHPSLQATVLKGLHHAFPNLQFIVTTHAPMVMSGVLSDEDNVVYKLSFSQAAGYTVNEVRPYGLDLSTISKVILNHVPRAQQVQSELDQLFALIDNDDFDIARLSLNRLRDKFGQNLPELTEAETILNIEAM